MTFNLQSFCPEAWSQIEISMAGDFSICCLANNAEDFGIARDDNDRQMNILTHSIAEALNSKTHKEHRLQLSRNEKPERCRNCYDAEYAAGKSKRTRVLRNTALRIPEYVNFKTAPLFTNLETGEVTSKVVNMHIRFGNLCNLKCIMCSPQHSNLWYEDWLALDYTQYNSNPIFRLGKYTTYEIKKDEHNRYQLGFEKWWETERWWDQFKEVMPQLRYLYFTGGEPFLVPALGTCLDLLIEADLAKHIVLRFDTNLSIINKKILDKLKLFKDVALCVSIDETNERFEFIRFPAKYNTFMANLQTLLASGIRIEYISSCIGNASMYAVPRVVEIANTYKLNLTFRFLEGPKWLDMRHLPTTAKQEIIAKFKELKIQHAGRMGLHHYDMMIRLMEKYIAPEHTNMGKLEEFVRCMDILDVQRSTNWRVTLDEEYDLLCRHVPDLLNLRK
jgi:organic radical activating enzyme